MRRLALHTATILATLTGALAVWELRSALVLFLLAVATSAAVRPLIDFWLARRVPQALALALTWLVGLVVPALLVLYLATGALVADVQGIADGLLPLYERVRDQWPHGNAVERLLAARLPQVDLASALRGDGLTELAASAVGVGVNVFSLLGEFAIIQILSIFWAANRDTFERLWLSLLPVDQRPRAHETWLAIKRGVGEKIRNDVAESLLTIALLFIGFRGIGLEYPILPALAGGIFRLVPLVGWLLALVTTLVAGLVTDPQVAVIASAYTAAVMITVELLVAPRFVRSRRYSSLLQTVAVLVLADAYGVMGLLIAPATAAALQVFLEKHLASAEPKPDVAGPSTAELEGRLEELAKLMASPGVAAAPELASLVERLTTLVAATEEATGQRTKAPKRLAA